MKTPITPLLPNVSSLPHSYSCPCLWRGWHLEALVILFLFSCSLHFAGCQILPFVIYSALCILTPRALGQPSCLRSYSSLLTGLPASTTRTAAQARSIFFQESCPWLRRWQRFSDVRRIKSRLPMQAQGPCILSSDSLPQPGLFWVHVILVELL